MSPALLAVGTDARKDLAVKGFRTSIHFGLSAPRHPPGRLGGSAGPGRSSGAVGVGPIERVLYEFAITQPCKSTTGGTPYLACEEEDMGIDETQFRSVAGNMYALWTLDCVVEIGHQVSRDFVSRPEFYKAGEISDQIVNLRLEYGTKSGLPNMVQRAEINSPIFGASDGAGPVTMTVDKFRSLRKPLLDACTVFSERSIADAAPAMRQSILSALELFKSYLQCFDGTSIRRSYAQIVSVSDSAYSVLRSPGVAQVFGVNPPPSEGWPLTSNDANGALLVRAIGEKLQLQMAPDLVFTDEKFQRLRRVAQQGSVALESILDTGAGEADGFEDLVTSVYTWAVCYATTESPPEGGAAMTQPASEFLRSGYETLDLHDLLRSPVSVLIGVNDAVVPELGKLGIHTVFDLGSSWLFANATAASRHTNATNLVGRTGLAPNDWLAGTGTAADNIPDIGVENLRGIQAADVSVLKAGMNAKTIREFALWPPYRFATTLLSKTLGDFDNLEDISTETLRPRFGEYPTERVYYQRMVMLDMGLGNEPRKQLDGPVSLNNAIKESGGDKLRRPAVGAQVTFSQSWYAQGVTLGQMLHSLALAPGECTRIAVIDWTRKTKASTKELISESEQLDSATNHSRSISEIQAAVASEQQRGGSTSWAESQSESGSVAMAAGTGFLTSLFASADVSATGQMAHTRSDAGSESWSNGSRDMLAEMNQDINDSTEQHSTSTRNRRASIVREVSQSEHEEVSTRIVANYNHMHALTVQYYEVVQVYRVSTELHTATRLLYIPMETIDFTDEQIIDRYRGLLMRWALTARVVDLLVNDANSLIVKAATVAEIPGSGSESSKKASKGQPWIFDKHRVAEVEVKPPKPGDPNPLLTVKEQPNININLLGG